MTTDPALRLALDDINKLKQTLKVMMVIMIICIAITIAAFIRSGKNGGLQLDNNILRIGNVSAGHVDIGPGGMVFRHGDRDRLAIMGGPTTRCLEIYDADGGLRLVVVMADLTNKKVGGAETTPESRITGFAKDGTVLPSHAVLP
jgi:hypothetical protein